MLPGVAVLLDVFFAGVFDDLSLVALAAGRVEAGPKLAVPQARQIGK